MTGQFRHTFVVLLLGFTCNVVAAANAPRIAIIIDDLGYMKVAGERAIALPGPVAVAILPGTPRARYLAELAHASGKDVLLHLPLQATGDQDAPKDTLVLDMNRRQFAQAFTASIAAVPHAIGVNSHRGSLLTRHPGHMGWLMEEISARGNLFFVDSYTTADSVALDIAIEKGVPAVRRHVFLDPDTAKETLAREFERLKALARRQGYAVGIGHPYSGTLAFLTDYLPSLEEDGIALVSISQIIAESRTTRALVSD